VNKSDLIESVSNVAEMTRHETDHVADETAATVKIVAGNGRWLSPAGALQAAMRALVRVATNSTRKTVGPAPA